MSLKTLPIIEVPKASAIMDWDAPDDVMSAWASKPVAAGSGDDSTISIHDIIGDEFMGEGFSTKRLSAALRSIGNRDVTVSINSPGGSMFDGIAMYNMLAQHPAKVTVQIVGIAASAASVIAMAGDEIQMGRGAQMMVHRSWGVAIGNTHDFAEAQALFSQFDESMAEIYAARTGMGDDEIMSIMEGERKASDGTYMSAQKAVDMGFADSIFDPPKDEKQDKAKAESARSVNATRRVDALLAKAGISRNERRSLIGEVKGGTHDAAATATHDAGELKASLSRLVETLKL
ncbi:head maturation protease, ClpP-related [Nitratireductor sp. GZWM139]|uniref:head maturation protease, ClpP-related n=1 Tax=Nitratireductor sp. GZWM139 TaxID=2950541 RepID=UPI0024BEE92A|nr:head maturation protease, ClpP-related [Nitratireductor sp. GZWM139]MDJ1463340.1 Clp protease ClpP [Nitratireductor sp. GZWM139]